MKLYELGSIILGISLVVLIGIGIISHQFLGHDNKVEESIEQIIKDKTGLDVDLTPESEEKVKELA